MVELLSVEGRDFCQLGTFKVPLDIGLVWVGGDNRDTAGASSNGAGKTNFLKSIGWALFGMMPDREASDDVIREGQANTSVTLEMSEGWTFTRERRRGVEKVSLFHEGEPWQGNKDDVREKLSELIGLDWRAYLATRYYARGFSKRFVRPETPDGDRKAVLHRIMGTEHLVLGQKYAAVKVKEVGEDITEIEEKIRGLKIRLSTMNTDREADAAEKWEEKRAERYREALKSAKSYRQTAKKVTCRSIKEIKIDRDKVAIAREWNRECVRLKKEAKRRSDDLDTLIKGGACPECGSKVGDTKESERHISKIERAITELNRRAESASSESDKAISQVRMPRDEPYSLEQMGEIIDDELREAEKASSKVKWYAERSEEIMERARSIKAEINPYTEQIESMEGEKERIEEEIEQLKRKRERRSETRAHWEFWKRGFGPSGLPSYIFDSVMPPLTERTNVYLETLADGDISVQFSSQKSLQSMEKRDKVGITWEIEGVKNRRPSDGQWRKLEIASELGLMDVAAEASGVAGLSVLILDEVLDGLDPTGRARLVQLLGRLRETRKTIFVVSHDAGISDAFEKSIVVVKEGGVSRLEMNL